MTATNANPVYFLLVDDLDENLLALKALLRRDGLVLLSARTGTEALELLLKHDVALALIDVQMPGMDGFELAELMRGSERTRRVPIIFLTAGVTDLRRHFRGYSAGAVDFLQKPIEADILRSKADVFYELYRQRQEVSLRRDELEAATEENARLLAETRQHAKALQEADHRKDEFLAMLAHELRNPLAPIRNAVEILQIDAVKPAEAAKAREVISRQVAHMTRLIDDLLDVARIARGKVQLKTEPCDLARIVRQTAEDYRSTLTAAGIELRVDVPNHEIPMMGDAVRLAQVLGNLLHNAGKFTYNGGTVRVQAVDDRETGTASVSVSDTGAGMHESVLERLFEPFSQADQSLARNPGGLGLGLALVRGIVELHGGAVTAESDGPGQGSRFTIRIPLHNEAAMPSNDQNSPIEQPGQDARRRILVVEDNRDAADILQLLLSFLGHEVQLAYDGQSGLAAARKQPPDVMISDLGLPGEMDGYGFARAVRSDAGLRHIHLIALSGYGQEEDRQRSRAAGFDQHLVKPIDRAGLEAALSNVPAR